MLNENELNIKFNQFWIDDHKKHFLSQLMLIEILNKKISILYDGGGFADRHKIMKNAITTAVDMNLISSTKRFYLFTGDNRPEGVEFDHVYFSIAGTRKHYNLILPDPYSFSWNDIGVKSYDETIQQINKISKENENNQINKVFWRGNEKQHFSRQEFINFVKENELFDTKPANPGEKNFIHISEIGKFSTLIDFPGQGYSARLKYLIHSNRPIIVYPREYWDLFGMMLEPDLHYISSLPYIPDTVQRCMIPIHNKSFSNFYSNNINYISRFFNEKNAILLLANIINKQAY